MYVTHCSLLCVCVCVCVCVSQSQSHLRIFLMTFLAFAVSLPLSLLRSVDSLSAVAISSLFFYSCLLIQVRERGRSQPHPLINPLYPLTR